MYAENDLQEVLAQRRRRWIVLLIPVAALAAVLIASLVTRTEWLTSCATILAGSLLIAGHDLFIKPLTAYATHVDNMLHGRKREVELPFASLSEDISLVDGVRYHALKVADKDEKGKPCDRLFYYDAEKPLPDFKEGDVLHIIYHDKEIASVVRV
ncbi:MAG: hypothetical protein J1E43_01560 [Christensenellaceae bacterium]|nr:hypothetical protein [Christensenellaceae bacterium]